MEKKTKKQNSEELNEIVIKDDEGKEYLLNILFTYHNPERNTDYAFVYEPSDEESVYTLKYGKNNEVEFVTDEEELNEAEEVFNAFNEDPKISELKK